MRTVSTALFCIPLIVLLFVFRHFLGDYFPSHVDAITQFYPYFNYLLSGGSSVTQHILLGYPLTMSPMAGIPILAYLAVPLLSTLAAYKLLIVVYMALAYVFTYLYARSLGFESSVAIVSATTFTLCGQLLLWAETLSNVDYYFLLPAVLYLVEQSTRATSRVRYVLLYVIAGALLGMGWLSGHPQYIVYICLLVGVYILTVLPWRRACAALSLTILTSLLVGSARIISTLDFQPLTGRAGGVGILDYFIHSYWPHDLIHYVLPFFTIPTASTYGMNMYVGILPLIFAISGAFLYKKIRIGNPRIAFLWIAYGVSILTAFKYSPLAYLTHALPFWSAFRDASRIMFIGDFALAILAGYTLQYFLQERERTAQHLARAATFLKRASIVVVTTSIGATLFYVLFSADSARFIGRVLTQAAGSALSPAQLAPVAATLGSYVSAILRQLTLLSPQFDFFLASLVLATLLYRQLEKSSSRLAVVAAVILIGLNFAAVYASYLPMVKKEVVANTPTTVAFIQENQRESKPFRVLPYGLGQAIADFSCTPLTDNDEYTLTAAISSANMNLNYGIDIPNGYDNFVPDRTSQAVEHMLDASNTLSIPILRMLNVRYIASLVPLSLAGTKPVFSTMIGRCTVPATIYEVASYWPRYFLTASTSAVVATQEDQTIDVLEHTSQLSPPATAVTLTPRYQDSSLSLTVHATDRQNLVFIGNAYLPRWRATIDGTPTPLLHANYLFMAVRVPSGTHDLVLTYDAPSLFSVGSLFVKTKK